MPFQPFPATACWQHRDARVGFEVAYFQPQEAGWRIDGTTTAIEDGQTWVVSYRIEADAAWATRWARVTATTLPVHRLNLAPGARADAPAAYVRAATLSADRLEQVYRRRPSPEGGHGYDYAAPAFGFTARLGYDQAGLIVSYPGIAQRAG